MYDTKTPRQVQESPSPKASKIACAAVIAAVVATYAISHISTIHANETELQSSYESNIAEAEETLRETGLDARGFEPLDLSWDEDGEATADKATDAEEADADNDRNGE